MPRRCCVPGCKSNYYGKDQTVSTFSFPKDEERKHLWTKAIHRKDFVFSCSSVVCIRHFSTEHVIDEDVVTRSDGTILREKRVRPKLTHEAVPTIFPGQPSYLSNPPSAKREGVERRERMCEIRDRKSLEDFMARDRIADFDAFERDYKKMVDWGEWNVKRSEDFIVFMRIDVAANPWPRIVVSLKIFSDLTVQVMHNGIQLPTSKFEWVLGKSAKCNNWTAFESLLSHLQSYTDQNLSLEDKITHVLNMLDEILDEKLETNDKFFTVKNSWNCYFKSAIDTVLKCSSSRPACTTVIRHHIPFCEIVVISPFPIQIIFAEWDHHQDWIPRA